MTEIIDVKWMKIMGIDENILFSLSPVVMQHYLIILILFFNRIFFSTKLEQLE